MSGGHNNLYVCGLPDGLDETVFRSMFEAYGTILSCKCVSDKRYGFVKFATQQEAEMAIQGLSGFELSGCTIQVRPADNDRGQKGFGKGMGDDWGGGGGWSGDGGWGGGGYKGSPGDGGYGGCKGGSSYSSPKGDGKGETSPSDNLYIKGLPLGSTEQTVHQIFGAYGAVTSCKVLSHVEGATTAAAMVRMGSIDQATWLVQNLNGNIPQGLTDPIQVKFANSGGGKGKAPDANAWGTDAPPHPPVMGALPPGAPSSWSTLAPPPPAANPALANAEGPQDNLYIKGLPVGVTEEHVREIFGAYGAVTSVRVLTTPEGADNAAALVRFNDVAQATWLVDNLNGNIPKGLSGPVIVRYANPSGKGKDAGKGDGGFGKDDRFTPYGKGGAAPAPLPMNFGQGEEGSNLYIRGLPATADDLYLYKVFAPIGAILSVKAIMSTETTQCAGYGFVKYATAEEAQKAIALMSATPLPDGNMLTVTVKSPGKGKGKDKMNGAPPAQWPQPPQWNAGGVTDFAALAATDPEAAAALKALSS